jgi:Ca2+-transporting ATPase
MGEIMTIFSGILFGWASPLTAIQLLWVNLVTDSLPAIALGLDRVDKFVMEKPPRPSKKSLFSDGMAGTIILEGAMIGALALTAFSIGSNIFDYGAAVPSIGRTMAFCVLSLSQLVHAFNMRSDKSLFAVGVFSNRYLWGAFFSGLLLQICVVSVPLLSGIFGTVALSGVQWGIVALLSAMPFILVELQKRLSAE